MVQDLMYLKRGGRISPATATIGTMLNVKPILKIDPKGKLETIAKKRGSKSALKALVGYFQQNYSELSDDCIYIIDADEQELGDELKDEIKKICPHNKIRRSTLTPIIGAHTGPGMVAVCHIGK